MILNHIWGYWTTGVRGLRSPWRPLPKVQPAALIVRSSDERLQEDPRGSALRDLGVSRSSECDFFVSCRFSWYFLVCLFISSVIGNIFLCLSIPIICSCVLVVFFSLEMVVGTCQVIG